MVISQNFSGHLVAHTDWPTHLKNKGVYFVKREKEPLPKTDFLSFLTCGDIHPNALDHFCAWVEEVSLSSKIMTMANVCEDTIHFRKYLK